MGAAAGPIGAGIGLAVGVGKNLYSFGKMARVAAKLGEAAKKAQKVIPMKASVARAAEFTARTLRMPAVKKATQLGAGNALEEVAIHYIEKTKGYTYDLAPAAAMGFFAPAVFSGLASLAKGGFGKVKEIRAAKKIELESENYKSVDLEETPVIKEQKSSYEEMATKMDEVKAVEEAGGKIEDAEPEGIKWEEGNFDKDHLRKVNRDELIDWKDHYRHLASKANEAGDKGTSNSLLRFVKTMNEVLAETRGKNIKVFGEEAAWNKALTTFGEVELSNRLQQLSMGLVKSGHRVALNDLYPFMRTRASYNARLKEAKQKLGIKRVSKLEKRNVFKEMFSTTEETLNAYHAKHSIDNTKTNKRDLDLDEKPIEPKKALDEAFDTYKNSDDPALQQVGQTGKQIDEVFETFKKCLKGEATDGN